MANVKLKQPTETKTDQQPEKSGIEEITDARGRKLVVNTNLDVLYESRLMLAIGPQASGNAAYMMCFVYPAAYVTEIDGVQQDTPITLREVEARIKLLGREGINAVTLLLNQKDQAAIAEIRKAQETEVKN